MFGHAVSADLLKFVEPMDINREKIDKFKKVWKQRHGCLAYSPMNDLLGLQKLLRKCDSLFFNSYLLPLLYILYLFGFFMYRTLHCAKFTIHRIVLFCEDASFACRTMGHSSNLILTASQKKGNI